MFFIGTALVILLNIAYTIMSLFTSSRVWIQPRVTENKFTLVKMVLLLLLLLLLLFLFLLFSSHSLLAGQSFFLARFYNGTEIFDSFIGPYWIEQLEENSVWIKLGDSNCNDDFCTGTLYHTHDFNKTLIPSLSNVEYRRFNFFYDFSFISLFFFIS